MYWIKDGAERKIAYFSMEIGLNNSMRTYAGGLGILAGDMIKTYADLGIPAVGVTLLSDMGYFWQKFDDEGNQIETTGAWDPTQELNLLLQTITVMIEGREVKVRVWRYAYKGIKGFEVPVYFLDTNFNENEEFDRTITSHLYGGDERYRVCQEIILGMGGVKALYAMGYKGIEKYHLNEGHSAFLALELLAMDQNIELVRNKCVFTTHTPVAAGHDRFDIEVVRKCLGNYFNDEVRKLAVYENKFNMTYLGLNSSRHVNGVAKLHGKVSREMFPGYTIDAITNGVHSSTWTSESFAKLYDEYISDWRVDPFSLRSALNIPLQKIWNAHLEAKKNLFDYINKKTGHAFDQNVFTIGFGRRATAYKRAYLLFSDIERLKRVAANAGKLQLVFAGKAHYKDLEGKKIIKEIIQIMKKLNTTPNISAIYMEDYDFKLGKLMTSGVDIWLNTPLRPHEASGTSGMKGCLNGVPSLSTLDGWWCEGHAEDITGWSIGDMKSCMGEQAATDAIEAESLYEKLEMKIMPLFYENRDNWSKIMRNAVALNASFFNTHRMVQEYVLKAYFL